MKTLKFIGIFAFILIANQLKAQDFENQTKSSEERAANQTKAIAKFCNLTTDQQLKVEKILLNTNNQLKELKMKKPTQRAEKLKEIQAIKESQNSEIKQILSAEQYQKYMELLEKQKEKLRERRMEMRQEVMENAE